MPAYCLLLTLIGFSLGAQAEEHEGMLKRSDLPIKVSDPVWDLIKEVQAIAPLQLTHHVTG